MPDEAVHVPSPVVACWSTASQVVVRLRQYVTVAPLTLVPETTRSKYGRVQKSPGPGRRGKQ